MMSHDANVCLLNVCLLCRARHNELLFGEVAQPLCICTEELHAPHRVLGGEPLFDAPVEEVAEHLEVAVLHGSDSRGHARPRIRSGSSREDRQSGLTVDSCKQLRDERPNSFEFHPGRQAGPLSHCCVCAPEYQGPSRPPGEFWELAGSPKALGPKVSV